MGMLFHVNYCKNLLRKLILVNIYINRVHKNKGVLKLLTIKLS